MSAGQTWRRSGTFVGLLAVVSVLTVVGLVMVLSSSSVQAIRQYGSPWVYFERQVLWVAVGAAVMAVCARLDYRIWSRLSVPLVGLALILLVLVLVPGVGVLVDGSSRWVGTGSFRIQPSELMKLALVVFGADLLARRAGRTRQWARTVRPMTMVFFLAGLLVMLQPDMGTTLVLASIVFGLLFAAGTRVRTLAVLLTGSVGGAVLLGIAEPYRRARLLSFLDPWAHRSDQGYQVVQSLVGLGSGHLWGVGLGASRAKWGFLPNAHTDFIFAIIGEELGLIGSVLVVALFGALAFLGIRTAARAPDRFGRYLAIGITGWIVCQAFINIGAVIGLLPVTGLPLPFVSFGGSSLVIVMAATGLLLSVAARERPAPSGAGRQRVTPAATQEAVATRNGAGAGRARVSAMQ
ncbi:MAG: putative lipid II flippase FtsW [Actinobacteria bacterium]|nr:MAG: putative lipid II flippase FtsW [Actinomycetota bacterium]